jgi:hypothetical protein
MSSQQLDELEKSLDDKPNRILRDRINRMDYSNSQSPNRRTHSRKNMPSRISTPSGHSVAPASSLNPRLALAQQENTVDSFQRSQCDEIIDDEHEASEPANIKLSIASYILGMINRWIISLSIDGLSYILSCIAVTLWGVAKVTTFALRFMTSKKMTDMVKKGYLSLFNFTSLKIDQFYKTCQPSFESARCALNRWTEMSKELYQLYFAQIDWSSSRSLMYNALRSGADLFFSATENAKSHVGRPLVIYRIKSFLITASIIWLAAVIVFTSRPNVSSHASFPPISDADVGNLAVLHDRVNALDHELKIKNEALVKMSEEFDIVLSLVKSVQSEQDMAKAFFEDSLRKMQESVINEIEQRWPVSLDIVSLFGPDYSLSSAGAFVDLKQTSSSFYPNSLLHDVFQLPSNSGPEQVLDTSLEPGNCWGMKGRKKISVFNSSYCFTKLLSLGSSGTIEIVLPRLIHITALVVKHADPKSLFAESVKSAPKHMEVYGKTGSLINLLGKLKFDPLKNATHIIETDFSSFKADNEIPPVERLIWKIKDNWGNPDWTCIYRLGVHGSEPIF